MNTKTLSGLILSVVIGCPVFGADGESFKDDKEKASYAIGMSVGNNLLNNIKREEAELDTTVLLKGISDALASKTVLTEAEMRETLNAFQQGLAAKRQEKRRLLGEQNKAEGEKFLAENKYKPGVFTLTNGLQYKVITAGEGDSPKREDMVTVKYRGTLVDGTEFDSSSKSPNGTAPFSVSGVIPGWTQALMMMKPGAKWELYIPPDLAYGEFGHGPQIGPNATLIFEIELVSTQPPPPPPPRPAPLTSDIIKVPSAEEMKKGAKIETIKAEDVEKLVKQQQELEKQQKKE